MAVKTHGYRLHVEFITPVLGTQSTREVATEFIAKKSGFEIPQDEQETLPEALERGTTVFHRKDDKPVYYDYHILGFLREAGSVLNGKVTGGVKNLRSKVENNVFAFPRQIELHVPDGADYEPYNERALRAKTARGPRVTLVRSEQLPEGTWFDAMLEVIDGEITENVLRDLFDFGYLRGFGQWRTGCWGRFVYTLTSDEEKPKAKAKKVATDDSVTTISGIPVMLMEAQHG